MTRKVATNVERHCREFADYIKKLPHPEELCHDSDDDDPDWYAHSHAHSPQSSEAPEARKSRPPIPVRQPENNRVHYPGVASSYTELHKRKQTYSKQSELSMLIEAGTESLTSHTTTNHQFDTSADIIHSTSHQINESSHNKHDNKSFDGYHYNSYIGTNTEPVSETVFDDGLFRDHDLLLADLSGQAEGSKPPPDTTEGENPLTASAQSAIAAAIQGLPYVLGVGDSMSPEYILSTSPTSFQKSGGSILKTELDHQYRNLSREPEPQHYTSTNHVSMSAELQPSPGVNTSGNTSSLVISASSNENTLPVASVTPDRFQARVVIQNTSTYHFHPTTVAAALAIIKEKVWRLTLAWQRTHESDIQQLRTLRRQLHLASKASRRSLNMNKKSDKPVWRGGGATQKRGGGPPPIASHHIRKLYDKQQRGLVSNVTFKHVLYTDLFERHMAKMFIMALRLSCARTTLVESELEIAMKHIVFNRLRKAARLSKLESHWHQSRRSFKGDRERRRYLRIWRLAVNERIQYEELKNRATMYYIVLLGKKALRTWIYNALEQRCDDLCAAGYNLKILVKANVTWKQHHRQRISAKTRRLADSSWGISELPCEVFSGVKDINNLIPTRLDDLLRRISGGCSEISARLSGYRARSSLPHGHITQAVMEKLTDFQTEQFSKRVFSNNFNAVISHNNEGWSDIVQQITEPADVSVSERDPSGTPLTPLASLTQSVIGFSNIPSSCNLRNYVMLGSIEEVVNSGRKRHSREIPPSTPEFTVPVDPPSSSAGARYTELQLALNAVDAAVLEAAKNLSVSPVSDIVFSRSAGSTSDLKFSLKEYYSPSELETSPDKDPIRHQIKSVFEPYFQNDGSNRLKGLNYNKKNSNNDDDMSGSFLDVSSPNTQSSVATREPKDYHLSLFDTKHAITAVTRRLAEQRRELKKRGLLSPEVIKKVALLPMESASERVLILKRQQRILSDWKLKWLLNSQEDLCGNLHKRKTEKQILLSLYRYCKIQSRKTAVIRPTLDRMMRQSVVDLAYKSFTKLLHNYHYKLAVKKHSKRLYRTGWLVWKFHFTNRRKTNKHIINNYFTNWVRIASQRLALRRLLSPAVSRKPQTLSRRFLILAAHFKAWKGQVPHHHKPLKIKKTLSITQDRVCKPHVVKSSENIILQLNMFRAWRYHCVRRCRDAPHKIYTYNVLLNMFSSWKQRYNSINDHRQSLKSLHRGNVKKTAIIAAWREGIRHPPGGSSSSSVRDMPPGVMKASVRKTEIKSRLNVDPPSPAADTSLVDTPVSSSTSDLRAQLLSIAKRVNASLKTEQQDFEAASRNADVMFRHYNTGSK